MNNIKTIAKYSLWEAFFPYMKRKKAANLPENYFLRVIYFIFTYIFLSYMVYMIMNMVGSIFLGRENGDVHYFTYFGITMSLMIVIFYIPTIISNFFSDKKTEVYKTLPISQGELFVGKIIGNVISYVDFILFFIISLVVYTNHKGFDISVLVFGLINFVSLILIIYSLLTFVILLIMRFTSVNRHKKLFKTLGYLLLFSVIGLAYALPLIRGENQIGQDPGQINKIFENFLGLKDIFFNAKFFGLAVGGDLKNKVIFSLVLFAISALILYLSYKFADKNYYKSLEEKTTQKTDKKQAKKNISFNQKSQVWAIFKRDIKNLFSNVVFIVGGTPMLIIFGFMGARMGKQISADLGSMAFFDPEIRFWVLVIGFLLSLLIWCNSNITSTALSREHTSFYLFQTLPIDPEKHYLARLLAGFFAFSIFNILLSLIFLYFVRFGISNAILFFLGLSLGSVLASAFGLSLGSKKIITNWNKPEELSKGGVINILYYFLSLIIVALLVGLGVFLTQIFAKNIFIAYAIMIIIMLAMTIFVNSRALNAYKKGFYDIND